jgi:transposase
MVFQSQFSFPLPGFAIDEVTEEENIVHVFAHSIQKSAVCPSCQQRSQHVHSHYQRSPADLPMVDQGVHLHLAVRRFRCQNPECKQSTFVERWPGLLAVHGQRTDRLQTALSSVCHALGGQAGSRLATQLKMPVSGDSLLRILRRRSEKSRVQPEVIGVDDWAQRRGRVYGTIIVDQIHHQVIDLLPDRTAETLAAWLKAHPQVKIVTRDRSGEYARGITVGAPQAQQIADRWHLLVNLREAVIRLLERLRPGLKLGSVPDSGGISGLRPRRATPGESAAADLRRARRVELHEKVHRLQRSGLAVRKIARQLQISPTTVYRYLSMSQYPERVRLKSRPSILDPFLPFLQQRWQAGERNASALWREIRIQGYPGTRKPVARWMHERREPSASPPPMIVRPPEPADHTPLPAARQLVWLFIKHTDQLNEEDQTLRDNLLTHATLLKTRQLIQEFQQILSNRNADALDPWLETCEKAGIPELANFAAGLRQEHSAVLAAASFAWSNGQTEGQVNRLKLLKRQMYGRANLDLLRLRILQPP